MAVEGVGPAPFARGVSVNGRGDAPDVLPPEVPGTFPKFPDASPPRGARIMGRLSELGGTWPCRPRDGPVARRAEICAAGAPRTADLDLPVASPRRLNHDKIPDLLTCVRSPRPAGSAGYS